MSCWTRQEFQFKNHGDTMLVEHYWEGEKLVYSFTSEERDGQRKHSFSDKKQVYFQVQEMNRFPEVHPDRLALVAIMLSLPFSESRLKIGWGISKEFKDSTDVISRIAIESPSEYIDPIHLDVNGRPSLAFSGGADSTAALSVMPNNTIPVFMLRAPSDRHSLYRSEAAEKSCEILENLGYPMKVVISDFEELRNPIGFPVDLAVGAPAILLSENIGIRSLAFGTILESAFGIGGKEYRNYFDSAHYNLWSTLFNAVGIEYSLPVAGVSEVGTSLILQRSPFGEISQSCIRGEWESPCMNCWKCFRKELLAHGLNKEVVSQAVIDMLTESKEVRLKLLENIPIRHECVLTHALSNSTSTNDSIKALNTLVRGELIQTDWLKRWNPMSKELISAKYRDETVQKLTDILGSMTEEDVASMVSWENKDSEERELKRIAFLNSLT